MDGNLTASDVALLTGNNRKDGMFGGDGAWWLIVLFLFAFCGWGNNGWGNNGNGGGYVATAATQADIQRGFDNSAVISKLDGINSGLCDGFYAMNNGMLTGFNGINTNIMQTGFGIQQAINADTVANMQNANALQAQLANCCCETREAIQGVNYNMAQNTCALQNTMNNNTRDIIDSQNAGTRAILDYLCNEKISNLQAENNDLRRAASQDRQSALLTTAMASQTVAANGNVVFSNTAVKGSNCIQHREGSGIITLRGFTNQCKARFFVDFSGNIAIPTGGTVGAISLAIAISGEPVLSSQMISTPAAVDQYNNVSSGIYIDVPRGCCVNIAVENTSDQAISVANANIVVTREA